ncbi:MAG: MBL fold metallo-hydrolase [Spirochaetales bacterium]|nr:MBL fold metallo-hydrolase [Spirochaetales bacterium]
MKIKFCGGVRTVTGSQHLLEVNGIKILLDCGMFQGKRQESYERNKNFIFDPSSIDLLILSHAHIDHSGNIPNLIKQGFKGDIICTYATRDLCAIMLRDSAEIQEYDIKYLNKKRKKKGEPPLEPLYSTEDAVNSLKYFLGMGYERERSIAHGVTLTLHDAGHILGSAIVELNVEDREAEKTFKLVFTGDLGRPDRPIICDPEIVTDSDYLLIESTYGDRLHEPEDQTADKLKDIINTTVKRGGKVIIPSFAVGRTQEVVYKIHRLINDGEIPGNIPVFVDSPLAVDATAIYRLHPEAYDKETSDFLLTSNDRDPFGFSMIRYTRSTMQSKELNKLTTPAIIISASGMAEAGRILHHLKNNIENPVNTILFVGWQAPDTLGRRILEKSKEVRIFGDMYPVKAEIKKINSLSAHADKNELLSWLSNFRQPPAKTFVVHGDEEVSLAFGETLREKNFPEVAVPELGEEFAL